ncbi:MAG: helix-hairpin-helix domain-containing protein, partial [Candidatus Omnitrophota bacterium]|nr:helix-hairpin-helix domain-containing protein [Candidatus Omnitrophota bacterium]
MKNKEVAELLNRMGDLLQIKGEIVFKTRAYHKAAENIDALGEDIAELEAQGRLSEIPGVGAAIQAKIQEYLAKGKMTAYEELTKDVPETLLDIVNIPTVGPQKAKLFYEKLNVKTMEDLRRAAEAGKLLTLPGIKEKTVENILKGIQIVAQGQERMNLGKATDVAEEIMASLKAIPEVRRISPAGSLRRGMETIGDIDILVESGEPLKVMDAFVNLPQVKKVNAHGETKSSILTKDNVQVDLRVVDAKSYGAALLYFTGSKSFNINLRQIAIKNNMKISEYGVFAVTNDKEKYLAGKTEEECFAVLGLACPPPELREEFGEEELFSGKKIPKIVELKDIQGELHVHSTYSDGRHSIAQMVEAAQRRGYSYLAISDHSPKLRVAGGVSVADLKKKKEEIDNLNSRLKGFRVLLGTELEID